MDQRPRQSTGRPLPRPQGAKPKGYPVAVRRPSAPTVQAKNGRPQPLGNKKKKRKRKESDFFYIHNKGVCFLMFLTSLVMLLVVAINFANMVPSLAENEMIGKVLSYASVYKEADYTPYDVREQATVYDEDENIVEEYEDQSKYYLAGDLFMGSLNALTGKGANEAVSGSEEEIISKIKAYAEETTSGSESGSSSGTASGTEEDEEETVVETSPLYDKYALKKTEAISKYEGYEGSIVFTIISYAPLTIALYAVIALVMMIKSFLALFGRRIFRGFALGSIICVVLAIAVLMVGISFISLDTAVYNEKDTLSLEFGQVAEFATSAFTSPYATLEEQTTADEEFATLQATQKEEEQTVSIKLPIQTNYGIYILIAVPAVTLILSLFSKKKIPYAIFD